MVVVVVVVEEGEGEVWCTLDEENWRRKKKKKKKISGPMKNGLIRSEPGKYKSSEIVFPCDVIGQNDKSQQ